MVGKARSVVENGSVGNQFYSMVYPTTLTEAFENSTLMTNQMEVELPYRGVPVLAPARVPGPTPRRVQSRMMRSPLVNDGESDLSNNSGVLTLEEAIEAELKHAHQRNPNVNNKKLRRTVSNRLSAQRARNKTSQYISELESKIAELTETISLMSLKIDTEKNKKNFLQAENGELVQRLNAATVQSNNCSKEIEKNKGDVKKLEKMQKEKQMNSSFFTIFQNAGGSVINNHHHYINGIPVVIGGGQLTNTNSLNHFQPGQSQSQNHFPY